MALSAAQGTALAAVDARAAKLSAWREYRSAGRYVERLRAEGAREAAYEQPVVRGGIGGSDFVRPHCPRVTSR